MSDAEDDFSTAGSEEDLAERDQDDPSAVVMATEEFDVENGADEADAQKLTATLKLDFDRSDVDFWFTQLEMHLHTAGVRAQWTKRLLLHKQLPADVVAEVKDLLRKSKAAAGATAYKDVKDRVMGAFGSKPEDDYAEAEALVLTGKPSQLLHKLINIVCKKHPFLENCCAAGQISGMWRNKLPTEVKRSIAGKSIIGEANMKDTCNTADSVHATLRSTAVSAAAAYNPALGLDTSADAPALQQVAATAGGKKFNSRQKAKTGSGGQNTNKPSRGEPHSDNPPQACCNAHWKYGRQAFKCRKPDSCPWANLEACNK